MYRYLPAVVLNHDSYIPLPLHPLVGQRTWFLLCCPPPSIGRAADLILASLFSVGRAAKSIRSSSLGELLPPVGGCQRRYSCWSCGYAPPLQNLCERFTGIAFYTRINDFYKPLRDFYTPFTPFTALYAPLQITFLRNNNTTQRLYWFGFVSITLKIRLLKLIFSKAHAHENF